LWNGARDGCTSATINDGIGNERAGSQQSNREELYQKVKRMSKNKTSDRGMQEREREREKYKKCRKEEGKWRPYEMDILYEGCTGFEHYYYCIA
jgi:hypothetical protein